MTTGMIINLWCLNFLTVTEVIAHIYSALAGASFWAEIPGKMIFGPYSGCHKGAQIPDRAASTCIGLEEGEEELVNHAAQ